MTSLELNKEKIRKKIKEKRDSLSTFEILKKSNEIITQLKNMTIFRGSKIIACYISFNNEVYTHGLIKEFISEKEILVPVIDKKRKKLLLSHLKNWGELNGGMYGILEPAEKFLRLKGYEEVDLVIVPGIVFDEDGNRIGYGGGYYDALLKEMDATKVALAFELQVMEKIPAEKHDMKMDFIITEKRIVDCR